MERIETIVAACIDEIKAGTATIETCLQRYPEQRDELEPLLKLAADIRAPGNIQPSQEFRIRARVNLMEQIHAGQARQTGSHWLWLTGKARVLTTIAAIVIILAAGASGTAYAAQPSLPGDALYTAKTGFEQLQQVFTFDEAASVELSLAFADTRLDEIETLAVTSSNDTVMTNEAVPLYTMSLLNVIPGDKQVVSAPTLSERMEKAIAGYEKNIDSAIEDAAKAGESERLQEVVATTLQGHFTRLDAIEDTASPDSQQALAATFSAALKGHMKSIEKLAESNPSRAAELNLNAMQGRLQRAADSASKGNTRRAEESLKAYEQMRQFGNEISNAARMKGHDTGTIDEMTARADAEQVEKLGVIHGQAAGKFQDDVEAMIDEVIEEHGKTLARLQENNDDRGPIPDIVLPNSTITATANTDQPGAGPGNNGGKPK